MPGRINCATCSQQVNVKQQSLRRASYGKCMHTKCTARPDQGAQLLRAGDIPFHCNDCWKETPTSQPDENAATAAFAAAATSPHSAPYRKAFFFPYTGNFGSQLGRMNDVLVNGVEGISTLTDELSQMRQENAGFRR